MIGGENFTLRYLLTLIFGLSFIIFAYIGGLLLLYPMEYLLFYSILLFFGIIGIMAAVKGNLPDIVFIPIWALIIVYSISGLLSPPPLDMGIIDELSIYTMGGFGGYYTFISFLLLIGNYYFEKYPEWNSKGDHTGIILLHYCNPIKDITFAGFWTLIIGISNRIPGLLKTEPYKIYHCWKKEQIRLVIRNNKVRKIWLFGHGKYRGIGTDEGLLDYSEFRGSENKDFIAQMHCNTGGGKSLVDYVIQNPNKNNSIVKKGLNFPITNWLIIKNYLKDRNLGIREI